MHPQVWADVRKAGWSPSTLWCCLEGNRWTSAQRSCRRGPGAGSLVPRGPRNARDVGAHARPPEMYLTF